MFDKNFFVDNFRKGGPIMWPILIVSLTALAVVHWNEKRIPDQRAELYESIVTWLSRAREDRKDRIPAER